MSCCEQVAVQMPKSTQCPTKLLPGLYSAGGFQDQKIIWQQPSIFFTARAYARLNLTVACQIERIWPSCSAVYRVFHATCLLRQKSHDHAACVQIHWPVTGNMGTEVVPSIQETWRAMEKLVKDVS